jgi:hypothetical protein
VDLAREAHGAAELELSVRISLDGRTERLPAFEMTSHAEPGIGRGRQRGTLDAALYEQRLANIRRTFEAALREDRWSEITRKLARGNGGVDPTELDRAAFSWHFSDAAATALRRAAN